MEGIQAGNTLHMEENLVKALPQIDLGPNLGSAIYLSCVLGKKHTCVSHGVR